MIGSVKLEVIATAHAMPFVPLPGASSPARRYQPRCMSWRNAHTVALSMGAIADNPSFRIRAQELQQMLANEDGVANVVAAIEVKLIAAGTMELGSAVVQAPIPKSG